MRAIAIERLENGRPRYTVRMHQPLSPRKGCPTFDVFDHQHGIIVHGPTTLSREGAEYCGLFSQGADIALMPLETTARQQELPL